MPPVNSDIPENPGSFLEMRLYPRLYARMPLRYQVSLPGRAETRSGEGILKNLSFGGVYFTCDEALPLEPGQVGDFSLAAAAPGDRRLPGSHLSARGLVVRKEQPAPETGACGIAVQFLSPLELSPA